MVDSSIRNDIHSRLMKLFKRSCNRNFDIMGGAALDKNLLGRDIRCAPRDLLYLHFEIEKEFNINIPQKEIAEGKFNSFNNIVLIIFNQLLLNEHK